MDAGQWLTHGTVWTALTLYVASECVKTTRTATEFSYAGRTLSSLGCAAFIAHVLAAFQFYHHWSHAAAYADTARQTAEHFGWNWGGGLHINYVFAIAWGSETVWAWSNRSSYLRRPNWVTWVVRVFFWFMIFNGTVVFAREIIRWFGLILCLTLVVCWWPKPKRSQVPAA